MKDKKGGEKRFGQQEIRLLEQLRQHPEIMARVQSILEIASNREGPLKRADEVEELLIEEMRRLGGATLQYWASQAEDRGQRTSEPDATVRSRKKKVEVVVCLWAGGGERADLAQLHQELSATPAQTVGSHSTGPVETIGTGADGLWLRAFLWPGCERCGSTKGLRLAKGAKGHSDSCPKGARQAGGGISAALSHSAGSGSGPCHCRGRRDDDLHGSTRQRKANVRESGGKMRLIAAQAKDSATAVYAATFGSVAETGRRWGHCARQAGWGLKSQIHAVGTAPDWIRRQSREVFREQGNFLCDFYHVSEYLGAAAATCRSHQPGPWRRTQQKRLRRGAVQKVLQALEPHLNPTGQSMRKPPVRNGYRYLNNRLDWVRTILALSNWDFPLARG